MAATRNDTQRLDAAIRATVKAFKEVSAMQIWTWSLNREGNLLTVEDRLEQLADAGMLRRVAHSFPTAYAMGNWK
jgi:hypothetical protein